MAGRSLDEFMAIKGIKEAKVLNIAAAFEIARRIVEQILAQQSSQT
jgi:DNA repair protein RadC